MRIGKRQYIDRAFWVIFLSIVVVSILALFSASSSLIRQATAHGQNPIQPIAWQIFYLFAGVGIAYGLQFLPSWIYRVGAYATLAIGLIFLALNAAHIGVTVNGATRWIRIGAITIQSSEIAKLGLIIVVADLLTRIKDEATEKRYFRIVLVLTAVTCLLIMLSNLSTAILLGVVIMLIMILARIPWKWIFGIIGIAVVVLALGYVIVEFMFVRPGNTLSGPFKRATVWVSRVDHMITEHEENKTGTISINDDNYQATLARVAVARGGQSFFGVLPGNSIERNHLPLAYADYIFAIIVEETGMFGSIILCFLYLAILFRACLTSSRYSDYSAQLMVMGLGLMITVQALVSMAVAVGLGPVTGQPLPMISKGGTSAIITSIYFGIMMGVAREQREMKAQQDAVTEESLREVPDIIVDSNE